MKRVGLGLAQPLTWRGAFAMSMFDLTAIIERFKK